jgi:hypothetical protein
VTLLVLFDVDRTLFLSSDSLYGEALAAAVGEVYGLQLGEDAFARTDNAGETARAGVRKLLAAEGVDDATIDAGLRSGRSGSPTATWSSSALPIRATGRPRPARPRLLNNSDASTGWPC